MEERDNMKTEKQRDISQIKSKFKSFGFAYVAR